MRNNTLFKRINSLNIGGFVAKEDSSIDPLWIEPRLSQIKKSLLPKKFKSVSKHLVRIK